MRKLIISLSFVSLIAGGLYFAQKTSASGTTTLAPAGTPLGAQTNYTWHYPITPNCDQLSGAVPFVAYAFTVTTSGNYTFTMNTTGFTGVIHLYQNSFDPNQPCLNQSNPQNIHVNPAVLVTASPLTVTLTNGIGSLTYIAVFSAQNPNDTGTFSASVSGPTAVTPAPPAALGILSQPASKSVSRGCAQTLAVYANGPLPQTFQWYEGISGDLAHSIIIPGANSHIYTTPPLDSDKSYWLRITAGTDHADTDTIKFKVYDGTSTPFSGSLDPLQTWNLTPTLCHPSGTFVHYRATHFRIPVNGTYNVHINGNFGNYQIIAYANFFDATQPCEDYVGSGAVNSDLSIFLSGGQDTIIVVSSTNAGVVNGDFTGAISSANSCTLPETIEETLLISGNPLDKAVTPGNTAALTFAYTGGSGGLKTIQWYEGASGDTSHPIANATTTNYTTPALSQTNNQTTYYYYWARVDDPGSFTHADTGAAVVSVITPPITYSDILSTCDDQYTQVNGPTTYYKIFPFKVSTDGSYVFSITANGFIPTVALYQGAFFTVNPSVNYYGPGGTQQLLASTNNYYLVITSTGPGQTGSFTLNVGGPALVVPSLRPEIRTYPGDQTIFRDHTATLSVTTNSPVLSYQWYKGTCTNKTPVSSDNSGSYTTPPLTDYQTYWVKVSYGVMSVNSPIALIGIRPQAITDGYIIDEDTTLNVAKPGVLANDKKADSLSLKAIKVSESIFGTHTLGDDGALVYTPHANANGPDLFKYKVSDGILESDEENVAILVRSINDPPVLTGGLLNNHTFNEDSSGGILHLGGLTYGPGGGGDEASQQLIYKVTAVPPASAGKVMLSDNTTVVTANTAYTIAQLQGMQFKPAANGYGGPYPFTFTVTDNGESWFGFDPKSITQSLNITVNAIADTPAVTSATTNENTQTASGLVLDRNVADGAEVGYFKIGLIKGGTVYKNDAITQINNEQFITYAEGHAGLKFKPIANAFSPNTIFSFEVRASLTNQLDGVGGTAVTATITVNPVAELPSVTGAATFVNLQTSSGLVITRNAADGSEIGYYKIASITNGTLFKPDGITQITSGQFITAAEGSAGLRFTPAQDSMGTGSFAVQGSADASGSGLGPAATANITVTKYNTSTSITSTMPAPSATGQQVTVHYSVLNTSAATPAPTGDVVVTASGGSETCTGTAQAGSCTLTLTAAGNPRTIAASYAGNNQFNSSAGTKDQVVNPCTQNTVVTSTADDGTSGTLRSIVANACAGSTITFDPTVFDPVHGPYVISLGTFGNIVGNLLIDRNLTITGPGANILTVKRSTGTHVLRFRIFNITSEAHVTISGLTIGNGYATGTSDPDLVGYGGGILNSGTLTVAGCVVSGNKAGVQPSTTGLGAGIYSSGSMTIINSTISGNDAVTDGGGLYLQAGSTTSIINSTISGNTSPGNGGGIVSTGTTSIVNSTLANNTATTAGGGIFNDTGTLSLGNSIVASNTSNTGPDVLLLSGVISSNGHNLIGKNDGVGSVFPSGSPNVNADIVGTTLSPIVALLGPLADNGGATPTHVPLPGSPAIDSGNNANLPADSFDLDGNSNTTEPLPLDQRGQSRIANTIVDIGAVEVSYAITATSGAGQSAMINSPFVAPLKATVTQSGKPQSGASVTFTAPDNGASGAFSRNLIAISTTDINGVATAPTFTANGTIGSYSVVAGLGGALPSTSFELTNTEVAKADQTISFGALQTKTLGDPDFIVSAAASSGLSVNFNAIGNCTLSVNTVHITAVGSCTITASQGGDSNYNAAPGVPQTFAIEPAGATVAYVESSGNCGVDKTPCFSSIQSAFAASETACTVNILGGSFNESIDLNTNMTVNVQGDTTVTSLSMSAGTLNGGSFILTLSNGNWTNNGGSFNPGTGTVNFAGTGQTIGGTTPTTFNGLSVSAGGVILNGVQRNESTIATAVPVDITVTGLLTLNGDLTTTDPAKVIMTGTATSAGSGDVVGNLQRLGFVTGVCPGNSAPCANTLSVGNPNNQITITDGTAPTSIMVTLAKSAPSGYAAAVQRNYTITPSGGSAITATLRLHYLDSELNGNAPESSLTLRRFDGSQWITVPPTQPVDTTNNWVESNAVHDFSPWTFSKLAPTASDGLISGQILAGDGTPVSGAVIRLSGTQTRKTITDANGNYYFSNVETSGFYTVTPSRVNYNFSPFNRSFSQVGTRTEAVFSGSFNGDTANPLDTPEYFVRQQYLDVLSREPDENGFNFWSDRIFGCGSDALCVNARRRDIAAQFFITQEFQQSASFIYNLYSASFGRRPMFADYATDRTQVVGGLELEAAKQAFAESFVQRSEFTAKYQSDTTAELFVDSLLTNLRQTAGVDLGSQRNSLISHYQRGSNQMQSRLFVLRDVTEMPATMAATYNTAFILTEYFGYLRRDPDQQGYDFWINVLNGNAGADNSYYPRMVCSFITSTEYQHRFSSVITHSNAECGP
jgi:hypothetical protein